MDNFSRTLSAALLGCSLTLVSGCDSSEQESSDTGQALEDNQAPIALAGTTQYVKVGQPVTLNGVQSFDKEGDFQPYFVGLNFDEVVVLPKGQEIEIEVFSPRTFGETEQLSLWFFWSMHGLNHYTQFEMFDIWGSIVTP